MKVAYQGIKGAYSYIASRYLFPEAELLGKGSFEAVYQALVEGDVEALVLPIENTVIGSIFEVYDLMFQHDDIQITGELTVRIDHNLLGVKGAQLQRLTQIYSHPKALQQCQKLFDELETAKAVIWEDTAAAAAYVALKQDPAIGAIASLTAAKEYGLEVLKPRVQSNQENYTRFVVVEGRNESAQLIGLKVKKLKSTNERDFLTPQPINLLTNASFKTSLEFVAAHEPGSLLRCLQPVGKHNLNMSKIESRPLIGSPFQYLFYLDFEHEQLNGELEQILEEIKPHTQVLRHLGTYQCGQTIMEEEEADNVVIKKI